MKQNYQKKLDETIAQITRDERVPTLLLHSCCAPCSSYCLEYLSEYFSITVFYYNPNIMNEEEYRKRVAEQKRLIDAYNRMEEQEVTNGTETEVFTLRKISFVEGDVLRPITVAESIDYIIHGASVTSSKAFVETPVETIMTAIEGTKNILELAKEK